jgi:hypothetical protein
LNVQNIRAAEQGRLGGKKEEKKSERKGPEKLTLEEVS